RDLIVTGVQTCALPICELSAHVARERTRVGADEEERGVGVIARQDAQHERRPARVGPVVEAESNHARANGDPIDRRVDASAASRSEERRVGKVWRSRWW